MNAMAASGEHTPVLGPTARRRLEMARAFRLGMAAAAGVAVVVVAAISMYAVRQILILAAVALFLAVGLDPPVRAMQRHGVRRGWGVVIVLAVLTAVVVALLASAIPPLVAQATEFARNLPELIEQVRSRSETLQRIGEQFQLAERLKSFVSTLPERAGGVLLAFLQQLFGAVLNTLMVLVLTIYFLADLPRLRRGLVRLFPARRREKVGHAADVVVDKVGSYIIGSLTVAGIAGSVALALFLIVGLPYPVLLAMVVALTALIPMIGASLGAVICTVVASLVEGVWPTGVVVLATFLVYQQVENYLIAPRVMQGAVDLPAMAVLLAGLIGASAFGLIGALMAIPIAAAVKVLLSPALRETPPPAPEVPPEPRPARAD